MTADEPVLWNIRMGDPRGAGEPYEWELTERRPSPGCATSASKPGMSTSRRSRDSTPGTASHSQQRRSSATGDTLTASLDTSSTPGTDAWELIVTGVGDDGNRYILDAGTILNSTFHGSAWDWLLAAAIR